MISRGQMYRQMYYGGGQGIMSLDAGAPSIKYTGDINPYNMMDTVPREQALFGGLKKAVKSVTGAVKDIVKSDVGKAALGIAGLYYAPALLSGGALSPGLAGWQSGLGFAGNVLKSKLTDLGVASLVPKTVLGRTAALGAIGGLTGFLSSQGKSEEEIESIKRDPAALKTYLRQYYTNLNPELINQPEQVEKWVNQQVSEYTTGTFAVGGRVGYSEGSEDKEDLMERVKKIIKEIESKPQVKEIPKKETKMQKMTREDLERRHMQDITRSMKANGDTAKMAAGIEGLPLRTNEAGVNEVDLRETGGFIPPVGVKEKADDIPAMLSNNEFVFTADAVRGMGNGDVERGAEKLYSIMKTLENGGRV